MSELRRHWKCQSIAAKYVTHVRQFLIKSFSFIVMTFVNGKKILKSLLKKLYDITTGCMFIQIIYIYIKSQKKKSWKSFKFVKKTVLLLRLCILILYEHPCHLLLRYIIRHKYVFLFFLIYLILKLLFYVANQMAAEQ